MSMVCRWILGTTTPRVSDTGRDGAGLGSKLTCGILGDWETFCAAIASQDTKTEFISTLAKWLGSTPTNFAFTDLYDTITGE